MDKQTATELEAAAFRRLVSHLQARPEVQNIDLMILGGFCRNCLSDWYLEAAEELGLDFTKDESRKVVYGMSYDEYKAYHQKPATPEQLAAFQKAKPNK
jgi:hypothetical protein